MRKDMAKVIVERPRVKGRGNRKGRPPRDIEDSPKKESMKKPYKDRKILNENLNPLKRFLHSQVGKKWDNVFSEISENIKTDSAVQKHVKDHIWDFVFKNIIIEDKKVFAQRRYYGKFTELRNKDLYVDNNGFLREYRIKNKTRSKYDSFSQDLKYISDEKSYILIENDTVYKVYPDPHIENKEIKHEATAKNAEVDFTRNRFNMYAVHTFFARHLNRIDKKHPYWAKYIELYSQYLEEKESKKKKNLDGPSYKAGDIVEFSEDNGSTFVEGVVNRVDTHGGEFAQKTYTYWISLEGGKNKMCSHYIPSHRIRHKG